MASIDLEQHSNPTIVADILTQEISGGLREDRLSLYSCFLLNQDALRLRRCGYRQAAWQLPLTISGVLALYMQRLVALAIDELRVAQTLTDWLVEDLPLLKARRPHFIIGILGDSPGSPPTEQELTLLSQIRSRYATASDDDGPYQTEVFPYDYYAPENVLLGRDKTTIDKTCVDAEAENLMLQVAEWS